MSHSLVSRSSLALRAARGVSLIEALVALVVVAVGMLALGQVQVQLRHNADVSRQRAEAVRFAQADMEKWRAMVSITGVAGKVDYADIVSQAATDITGETNLNTVFKLERAVVESPDGTYKRLRVIVKWMDARNVDHDVELHSVIAKTDPALAGQLTTPPVDAKSRNPMGRNIRVPTSAINLGDGSISGFVPPGQSSGYYVINNSDATIIQYCTSTLVNDATYTSDTSQGNCSTRYGYTIQGFINFDLRNNISAISPGSTVCDFYSDLQAGTLIDTATPTQPTLNVASFVPRTDAGFAGVRYFNAFTLTGSTPSNLSASVSSSTALSVTLKSDATGLGSSPSIFFASAADIVLRIKNGATVATFRPVGTGLSGTGNRNVTVVETGNVQSNVLSVAVASGKASGTLALTLPSALAANTIYELVVPSGSFTIYRNSGNQDTVNISTTITFTTGTPPSIASTSPSNNGSVGNLTDNFSVTFDRNVVFGSTSAAVKLWKQLSNGNWQLVESFIAASVGGTTGSGGSSGTMSISEKTLTINPGADLVAGTNYSVTIDGNALKDANDFAYPGHSDNSIFKFSTASTTAVGCPTTVAQVLNYMEVRGNDPAGSGTAGAVYGSVEMDAVFDNNGTPTATKANAICYSDAQTAVVATTTTAISYFCVIFRTAAGKFDYSGTFKLYGPQNWLNTASSLSRYKVCRYHDYDNSGADTNLEHPPVYLNVAESITDQNFLVIKKNKACADETLNIGSPTNVTVHYNMSDFQP